MVKAVCDFFTSTGIIRTRSINDVFAAGYWFFGAAENYVVRGCFGGKHNDLSVSVDLSVRTDVQVN